MSNSRLIAVAVPGVVALALAVGVLGLAAREEVKQGDFLTFYVARENVASPRIKEQLAGLREEIVRKSFDFKVGYTTAMDRPLLKLAGARPPENFLSGEAWCRRQFPEEVNGRPDAAVVSGRPRTMYSWHANGIGEGSRR